MRLAATILLVVVASSNVHAIVDCKVGLDRAVRDAEVILVGRIHGVETIEVECETSAQQDTLLDRRCGHVRVLTVAAQDYLRGGGPKRPRIHLAEESVVCLRCSEFPLEVNLRVIVMFEAIDGKYWSLDGEHTVYVADLRLREVRELLREEAGSNGK